MNRWLQTCRAFATRDRPALTASMALSYILIATASTVLACILIAISSHLLGGPNEVAVAATVRPEGAPGPKIVTLFLTIKEPKRIATDDSAIWINLRLRNGSTNTIIFDQSYPERDFDLVVDGPSGHRLMLTSSGRANRTSPFSRSFVRFIPGQEQEYQLRADRMYAFDEPGVYSIAAQCTISVGRERGVVVFSNRAFLTNVVRTEIGVKP